ncbi:hypothetical protein E4T56_gene7968 [Termitomyces sp. T112]|nr:hypothetical protein E4T56_gene7968 [Termitomyces sp. T112]
MTPFFLDTGRHPHMEFEPQACPSENHSVNEFVNQMRRAQEEAKAALVKAKEDMACCVIEPQPPEVALTLFIQVPNGFSGLFHQKEGWLPLTGTGLLGTQHHDSEQLLPPPPHL